jgi:uncharacterized protein (TIGR02271 family)
MIGRLFAPRRPLADCATNDSVVRRTDVLEDVMQYQITRGWAVYDVNNDKLGEVADTGENYLLVQKGLLFIKDVYVPTSAIRETDDVNREVYLNVAKDTIDSLGWDAPPTLDRGTIGDEDRERMTLHEEELQAEKRREQAGEVKVNKRVVSDERELDVPVTHDEVEVKRTRVDREAAPGDAAFVDEGDTLRVPVTAETVDVTKRPRVVEEIEVSKRPVTEKRTVRDTVRREEADVDEEGDIAVGEGSARDLAGAGAERFERTNLEDVDNIDR